MRCSTTFAARPARAPSGVVLQCPQAHLPAAIDDCERVIGWAATYAEALEQGRERGYRIGPEGEDYDCGHVARPGGPDAYGVTVLV
jgi:hypothetical protein